MISIIRERLRQGRRTIAYPAGDPPLSLRWVGFEPIDDVQSLLEMNTAGSWSEFRKALSRWACSATNFIFGDAENNVGYQMSARVPLRKVADRTRRYSGSITTSKSAAASKWNGCSRNACGR